MKFQTTPYDILVVDDTPSNLKVVSAILDKEQDYIVSVAMKGEQALERAERCAPDLILLDIMMPGLGGFETCQRLKNNKKTQDIPVIFMTALADIHSKVKGFSLGAVDYITKPFHEEEVLARVKAHLDLRTAQQKLQDSEKRLTTILSSLKEVVWSATLDPFELIYLNSAVKDVYGESAEYFLESPQSWIEKIHPEDQEHLQNILLKASPGSQITLDYRILHNDSQLRWLHCQAQVSLEKSTQKLRLDGIVQDISQRKQAENQLRHIAQHDPLTNLANRSFFLKNLEENIRNQNLNEDEKFGVVFVDLDRFKSINDTLGHGVGDKLLIRVSQILLASIRPSDIVARLGGDEFTILLRNIVDTEDVVRICDRIQNKLKIPIDFDGQKVFITASIGIAMNSGAYEKAEDMLRDADIAMYQAKYLGKACHQFFTSEMYEDEIQKLTIEKELNEALEKQELILEYQPIKNLRGDKLEGFEALVRWHHPRRGTVSPVEFIPILEETGLIVSVGSEIIRHACSQLKEWQDLYPESKDVFISINISARQIEAPDFLETIDKILLDSKLKASNIRLEITESMLLENVDLNLNVFQSLRARGIQLSLDDFGTGYSSLSYLHKFPIDTLKIDRSFVQAMRPGVSGFEIIRTITALARTLDMDIVAEGVETSEQVEYLKELNCDMAQGYFFSRPLSKGDAKKLIQQGFEQVNLSKPEVALLS